MADEPFTPDPEVGSPEPAPAAEPSWAPPQEEWNQIRSFVTSAAPVMGQLAQIMQARAEAYQAQAQYEQPAYQGQGEDFDPFEPETVQRYIQDQIQSGIQQSMEQGFAPYAPLLETVASTEGERQARQHLDSLKEEVGAFDEDGSLIIAAGLLSQGNVMPDHALRVAAKYMAEIETRIREDERNRYMGELNGLRQAPGEHPVGSLPATEMETVPVGAGRYQVAIERALARRHPIMPTG